MIRLVFLGTPSFAVPFLEALAKDAAFEICAAVSQPDKPSGRGHALKPTPIKTTAELLKIPVLQPASLKSDATITETLRAFQADFFVVVAYGKLIPKKILEIPRLGCINVHPSLLPRHRGPSPMQAAIAEGDFETGVTVMLLDEGMDTGSTLANKAFLLAPNETAPSLETRVQAMGAPLLVDTLKRLAAGTIKPMPQMGDVSVTRLLEREDGKANWYLSAVELDRKRRAYTPWPGFWTMWKDQGVEQRLKLIETQPSDAALEPGLVCVEHDSLLIGCKIGSLRITKIQPENSPPMSVKEFVNGHKEIEGATLV